MHTHKVPSLIVPTFCRKYSSVPHIKRGKLYCRSPHHPQYRSYGTTHHARPDACYRRPDSRARGESHYYTACRSDRRCQWPPFAGGLTGWLTTLAGHQCAGTDLSHDCDAPMPSPAIKLDEPPERVIR
jgi:hypothetical protein